MDKTDVELSALDPFVEKTLVSFVIPTLNRGHYVARAVSSCLAAAAECERVDVEVIVLDSCSDDGSWELLQQQFSQDGRVRLAQNARGLGPTRSWLDGADLVTGNYVTFLWSDDYLSASFLRDLLPHFEQGVHLVVGRGLVRDVDDVSPFPQGSAPLSISSSEFLYGYFARRPVVDWSPPNSPACAIFSREAFENWKSLVEVYCTGTSLRQEVMWRRAIGPDLLLFLLAAATQEKPISIVRQFVTQFSSHPGSISIATQNWLLDLGYWLARNWLLKDKKLDILPGRVRMHMSLIGLSGGLYFSLGCRADVQTKFGIVGSRLIFHEMADVWACIAQRDGTLRFLVFVTEDAGRQALKYLLSLSRGLGHRARRFVNLSNRNRSPKA